VVGLEWYPCGRLKHNYIGCVLVSMCVGISVWLVGVVSVWQAEAQLY